MPDPVVSATQQAIADLFRSSAMNRRCRASVVPGHLVVWAEG